MILAPPGGGGYRMCLLIEESQKVGLARPSFYFVDAEAYFWNIFDNGVLFWELRPSQVQFRLGLGSDGTVSLSAAGDGELRQVKSPLLWSPASSCPVKIPHHQAPITWRRGVCEVNNNDFFGFVRRYILYKNQAMVYGNKKKTEIKKFRDDQKREKKEKYEKDKSAEKH